MRKYILTILIACVASSALAKTEAEFRSESDTIRKNQYSLKFNKFINLDCRIAIFVNKTSEHFIIKKFKPNSMPDFKTFIEKQDKNLLKESEVYPFSSVFEGATKNHSFYFEGQKLISRYEIQNAETKDYSKVESVLDSSVSCE